MKTYRVYFNDGNQMLLECKDLVDMILYIVECKGYNQEDIIKIEVVQSTRQEGLIYGRTYLQKRL